MLRRDPLANAEPLIRRVYAYVAYRLGPGADADDVTSDVFEQALRYRDSYDPSRGEPLSWLFGIARRQVAQGLAQQSASHVEIQEATAPGDLEAQAIERVTLRAAVAKLGDRDQELIALRYGADLRAREIALLLGLKTNAVEVALHRALARLRAVLEGETQPEALPEAISSGQRAL